MLPRRVLAPLWSAVSRPYRGATARALRPERAPSGSRCSTWPTPRRCAPTVTSGSTTKTMRPGSDRAGCPGSCRRSRGAGREYRADSPRHDEGGASRGRAWRAPFEPQIRLTREPTKRESPGSKPRRSHNGPQGGPTMSNTRKQSQSKAAPRREHRRRARRPSGTAPSAGKTTRNPLAVPPPPATAPPREPPELAVCRGCGELSVGWHRRACEIVVGDRP